MYEASFYESGEDRKVRCLLCPHHCHIGEGRYGTCGVRLNIEGKLYALTFGHPSALHVDPIEKKPLYHFHPGKKILSVGTLGCNLHCAHCQNHSISQCAKPPVESDVRFTPEMLVGRAASTEGNIGIAYTYNEPAVFYEYLTETAILVRQAGMANVVVSNGFIEKEPLRKLIPLIDAFNIDLKSFSGKFYREITGGWLQPVLDTLKEIAQAGKHLEITLLVIPSLNDSEQEFNEMVRWIATELGVDTPLHLSRYFPSYRMQLPPTPESTLLTFARLASEKLNFVYTGNIRSEAFGKSVCPVCKTTLIERNGYEVSVTGLSGKSSCLHCGNRINMVM